MALLLANENVPLGSVRYLRALGHDILFITEFSPGVTDLTVLELAVAQQRILLTFDRDYGELLFLRHLPIPPAVILLRFDPMYPDEAGEIVANLLSSSASGLDGFFVVLDRDRLRKRALPP